MRNNEPPSIEFMLNEVNDSI